MNRAVGIADRALRMAAIFLDGFDSHLQIAAVIQRIEDTENVHPVFTGECNHTFQDVIRIVLVTQAVLTAQQHLERRLLGNRLDLAQTFPGVFAQKPKTDVKSGSAPALQRIIADVINLLSN